MNKLKPAKTFLFFFGNYTGHFINSLLFLPFLFMSMVCMGQERVNPQWLIDKNYCLLSMMEKDKAISEILEQDTSLQKLKENWIELLKSHGTDTCKTAASLLQGFRFTPSQEEQIISAISEEYRKNQRVFEALINGPVRKSGSYQRYAEMGNLEMLQRALMDILEGMNQVIDQYGLGINRHYGSIDAASYDIHSTYYQNLLKDICSFQGERIHTMNQFFKPSLNIAIQLLLANGRDEAGRFEPMEKGANRVALEKIRHLQWDAYPYSAILVPGEGPELPGVAFDPIGRMRCELAATRYHAGLAPFIIVSGGNVHPFHTPYTEALEMKNYLVEVDSVPPGAIILEPHARHTTTNFRNAGRLMIHYGIPVSKPAICVSTQDQENYIMEKGFDLRNLEELGYLPYRGKQRLSVHEILFYTVPECLQADPRDPLDP